VFKRKTSGSVLCTSCGVLVGVGDDKCYNCGRRNPALWGWAPALRELGADLGFVPFVMGACVLVYALTLISSSGIVGMQGLSLLAPDTRALILFGASGAYPVFVLDRWWTVLSAGWLHAGILHIFMNMLVFRQLAPGVADMLGPGRTVLVYIAGSVGGFALSSFAGAFLPPLPLLRGAPLTVGASASIAALIGAILAYGHRSGSTMARSYAGSYITMLVLYGFIFPGIDNYAHLGGFGAGYIATRLLDPLKPERVDHIILALICVGLSLLSIVASVLQVVVLVSG
jgi:rhomboid protease GluP